MSSFTRCPSKSKAKVILSLRLESGLSLELNVNQMIVLLADELVSLQSTSEAASQVIAGQFVSSLILNIILSGTLSQLWNIFNTMQLLTSLPMFSVKTPGNVITMNENFNEIANFKIVEKEQLYDWVVVPIFGTETSKQKQIDAGVLAAPTDSESTNE